MKDIFESFFESVEDKAVIDNGYSGNRSASPPVKKKRKAKRIARRKKIESSP